MQPASDQMGLIIELITLSRPLDDVLHDLGQHHQDVDSELVRLERSHIAFVLRRYLTGELDDGTIEAWANAIDLRDDVGVPDADQPLREAVYELANPALVQPLTPGRAKALIGILGPG